MADLVERRHQMQKMSLIFRNAVNVCIWLGSGDYSSSEAIKFTKKLVNLETIESPFDDQDYSTSWIWFFQLLQRPWFSRRWVVMEVALAKEATIHCGSDVVHWDDFRDAIAISYQHFSSLGSYLKLPKVSALHDLSPRYLRAKSLVDVTSNMIRRMRDGAVQSTIDLETLVSSLCDLYSPDPRDTIFAFLCICKEFNTLQEGSERPSTLVPDYTKHPIRIYQRFVKWVIATSNSLDIICRRWAQFCDGLPSWILDFDPDSPFLHRRPSDSLVGLPGRSHYMASGKSHPIVTFKNHRPHQKSASMSIPTRSLLIAIGRDIGRLRWSSQPILDGVIPRTSLERLGWTQQLSEEMQRVPDKLWRTLVADRGPNGSFAPAYYHRAALFCLLHSAEDGHINTEKLLRGDQSTIVHEFLQRMEIVTRNRVILHGVLAPEFRGPSSHGREPDFVGIGPPDSQPGDVVAILYGCSVPVILRHNEGGGRRFIGEAFIYGYMDGEVPLDDSTKETFTLI
jgi:hypothetical protein